MNTVLAIFIRMIHWTYITLRRLQRARGYPIALQTAPRDETISVHERDARLILNGYLARAGYESMTEFAEQYPFATNDMLARELGLPVNLYWSIGATLLREAETAGAVDYHVRSLIVRHIHNRSLANQNPDVGNGGIGTAFEQSLIAVAAKLPMRYRPACYRIALAHSMSRVAFTWTPNDADDINLQELFSYWDASSVELHPTTKLLNAKVDPSCA